MGIISGPGSFAVQFGNHLRSGINCGPGIICGPVQYECFGLSDIQFRGGFDSTKQRKIDVVLGIAIVAS